MRVLIACEFSGVVRDAFRDRGHEAVSCDLLPSDLPGPHVTGDVLALLGDGWDLMIAHPPCTYLANSGTHWLYRRPGRWELLDEAAAFFRVLLEAPIPRVVVENPIVSRYAVARIGRRHDQVIQPWMFGHPVTKATCLWLRGVPPLMVTRDVRAQVVGVGNEWMMRPGPSADRWKLRSRTFPGIAAAMASQWG